MDNSSMALQLQRDLESPSFDLLSSQYDSIQTQFGSVNSTNLALAFEPIQNTYKLDFSQLIASISSKHSDQYFLNRNLELSFIVKKLKKHLVTTYKLSPNKETPQENIKKLEKQPSLISKKSTITRKTTEKNQKPKENRHGREHNDKSDLPEEINKDKAKNKESNKTQDEMFNERKNSEIFEIDVKEKKEKSDSDDKEKSLNEEHESSEEIKCNDDSQHENSDEDDKKSKESKKSKKSKKSNSSENGDEEKDEKIISPKTQKIAKDMGSKISHTKAFSNISSDSNLADVSKNVIVATHTKLIKYKFEEISLQEFQKRLSLKEQWIEEKLSLQVQHKQILAELLSFCRIVPKPEDMASFPSIIENLLSNPQKTNRVKSKKSLEEAKSLPSSRNYNYTVFIQACINWYNIVHFPKDLKSKLIMSIKEYESIKQKMLPNEDQTFIDSLLTTLKTQLKKVIETSIKTNQVTSLEDKGRSGAHEIFIYYSKPRNLNGSSVLEPMKKKIDSLTMNSFLQFCKDFNIIETRKNYKKSGIRQEQVEEVFLKNSTEKKDMYEYQFIQGLEQLAVIYYDDEFDEENKTNWKKLQDFEKLIKLFEMLNFHEPLIYMKKLKNYKISNESIAYSKLSLDISKNTSLSPRVLPRSLLPDKIVNKSKGSKSNAEPSLPKPLNKKGFLDKPVTWEDLQKSKGEQDYDLMKLISKESSDDDSQIRVKDPKINQGYTNSISHKILKRADELTKFDKKYEDDRLKQIFRVADQKAEKNLNFARKYKK